MPSDEVVSDQTVDDLMAAAKGARSNAYAPYSRFAVGAAVLAGGRIFAGVNVENAAYPQGICAERAAVAAAVTAGHREIDAVAVVAGDDAAPPCGGCRQVLHEFGPEMLVVCEASDGGRKRWRLSQLLPEAFGPEDLA
ncbi:MAG TPA: cytidine deaminase [Actinomycetota bacterium]|jgi:cytidine deaminase|nr:cytidine deaminase [Actinomycetota bacterium]